MITCPAITPTVELESPEHSSATANTVAAAFSKHRPQRVVRVLNRRLQVVGVNKRHGCHQDHRGIDQPGSIHRHKDIDQLIPQKTPENLPSRSFSCQVMVFFGMQLLVCRQQCAGQFLQTRLHQRGMKIDHMRHHRGAQHPDSRVNRVVEILWRRSIQRRDQRRKQGSVPIGMNQEHLEPVAEPDHSNQQDDSALEPQMPRQIERKNPEHEYGRYQRRQQKRRFRAHAMSIKEWPPNSKSKPIAAPRNSARSVAMAAISGRGPQRQRRTAGKSACGSSAAASAQSRSPASPTDTGSGWPSRSTKAAPKAAGTQTACPPGCSLRVTRIDISNRSHKRRTKVGPHLLRWNACRVLAGRS